MIDFAILALPRSGTAWISNLFTDNHNICIHDPLVDYTVDQLLRMRRGAVKTGISDTALIMHHRDVIEQLTCPIVKIHRDIFEINESLRKCGINYDIENEHLESFSSVHCKTIEFADLWSYEKMASLYDYLTGNVLSPVRHRMMTHLNIQAMPSRYAPNYNDTINKLR